jgi:hypothetical protein
MYRAADGCRHCNTVALARPAGGANLLCAGMAVLLHWLGQWLTIDRRPVRGGFMTQSNHRPDSSHGWADPQSATPELLGLAEHAALEDAVTRANPQPPAALIADAVAWARSVRLHALLLDEVLAGQVDIVASPDGGDLSFRQHGAPNVIPFGPASRRVRPRRNSG